jgi:DNA-binding transcriptional LysR family regulator
MRYELTDLKVFLAVAAHRSLGGGAEAVHMTAPSASYRIKNLEQALGSVLFERTSKGMVLTAAGVTARLFAENIIGTVDRLDAEMARHKIGTVGNIRLFANSSTLTAVMPILSTYLSRYPNVNVDLEEHLSEEIVKAVSAGNADIGLIAGMVDAGDLHCTPYGEDELVFITPPHHPLCTQANTSLANAMSYDLISVGRETSNFRFLETLARQIGTTPRVRVHAPNFDAVIRCVKSGAGIALVPLSTVTGDIAAGNVRHVRVNESWAVRKQQLVTRNPDALPEYAKQLIASIVERPD